MANYLIKDTTLSAIANSIRNKTGSTESIQVADMANEINNYNPKLQDKTVTPTTSTQTIIADDGYDGLDTVTVNAMPTTPKARPSITVSSSGLITASYTQGAGYVTSGTTSSTKQLTVQAAQTITPGTSNKTIASGRYLTGTQTIKGDSNLVAGNIKKGVSIFGVTGTHEGGEDLEAVIAEQAELISELESVLDSKAAGGCGGSLETCTVTVTLSGGAAGYAEFQPLTLHYSKVTSNGLEYAEHIINSDSVTINDIAKNSVFLLHINDMPSIFGGSGINYTSLTYLETIFDDGISQSKCHYSFFTSSSAGAITIS